MYIKNRKRQLKQIEEAYEAVVGDPPGKAAHKQQIKPGKPISKTWERAGKKVKLKGSNTDIPAEKPEGYKERAPREDKPRGDRNRDRNRSGDRDRNKSRD